MIETEQDGHKAVIFTPISKVYKEKTKFTQKICVHE
jgi:hypothetical protein